MPSTHLSLHYHLVFSTKNRAPLIASAWRGRLHAFLGGTVNTLGGIPEAMGGVADHVHLLIGCARRIALRTCCAKSKPCPRAGCMMKSASAPLHGRRATAGSPWVRRNAVRCANTSHGRKSITARRRIRRNTWNSSGAVLWNTMIAICGGAVPPPLPGRMLFFGDVIRWLEPSANLRPPSGRRCTRKAHQKAAFGSFVRKLPQIRLRCRIRP